MANNAEIEKKFFYKEDRNYYINCAVGLILMFGFGFLPGPSPITPMGMKMLGIFFGLLYLWSTCGLLWPSIMGFVAVAISGAANADTIMKMSFGNSNIMLMVFVMAVVAACEKEGIFEYLTNWMLTRKFLNGNPWALTAIFFIAALVLSALSSSVPVIFMLWAIFYNICNQVGLKKGDKYVTLTLLGIVFAGVCGSSVFPFKDTALIFIAAYTNMSGVTVPYVPYITLITVISIVVLGVYLLSMKYLFRADVTALKEVDTATFKKELPPMTHLQKFLGVYSIVMVLMLALPAAANFMGGTVGVALKNLSIIGMSWILFAILAGLRSKGKAVLDFGQLVNRIPWDLIFLVGAAMVISGLLTAPETGVKEYVAQIINPIFQGKSSFVFLALICAITLILTNVANNAVVAFMMLTMTYLFSTQFTINQPLAVSFINFTCVIAFLLPASSMFGAMLHANTEWLISKDIYKYAIFIVVISFLVLVVVGIPLGNLLY